MAFPYQLVGNNGRNPTLLPNLYRPFSKNGQLELTPSGDLATDIDAQKGGSSISSGNVTIAGTVAEGDVLSLSIENGVLGDAPIVATYTLTSTDTLETAAANLASAFNDINTLIQFGFWANSNGAEIIVNQRGPVGNFSTLSFSTTGAETDTIVQMTGGEGVIVPLTNFTFANHGSFEDYWYGLPYDINYTLLSNMVDQGMSIS